MAFRESDDSALFEEITKNNNLRQYSLLSDCIRIGLRKGIDSFDKYMLWSLNAAAVANITQHGGRFRQEPVYVGNRIPPPYWEVPNWVDLCLSFVHENWHVSKVRPLHLPAYVLWRLNWIHPFPDGNGRTARAACYYLICLALGRRLPGKETIPDRITRVRQPYYDGLIHAHAACAEGGYDVSMLEKYLEELLTEQLDDAAHGN